MTSLEDILTRVAVNAQLIGAHYVKGKIDNDQRKERIAKTIEDAFIEMNRNEQELQTESEVL